VTPSMEISLRRRRSKRLALRVSVIVYGRMRDKSVFHEKTRTLSVSAHGGMLALAAPVLVGQTILAVNEATGEEQEARVVYVEASVRGKAEVGIAFVGAAPNFWQVSFPAVRRKSSPN
jgi:acyl-coenzyme A thioesterase PaaI-like protein